MAHSLGMEIKHIIAKLKGLNLSRLAAHSGLSRRTLTRLRNDEIPSPTWLTMIRLQSGLKNMNGKK